MAKKKRILVGVNNKEDFVTTVPIKELKGMDQTGDVKCPFSFQCIVGRHHKGDENGQTYYFYKDVWVKKKLASDDTKIKLSVEDPVIIECIESSGEWMQSEYIEDKFTEYRPMTRRKHTGDENKKTYYEFSMLYFEIDENGDIINPEDTK